MAAQADPAAGLDHLLRRSGHVEEVPVLVGHEQAARTPLRRLATPGEIGAAVLAVASVLKYSNGCIIPVDGGRPLT